MSTDKKVAKKTEKKKPTKTAVLAPHEIRENLKQMNGRLDFLRGSL